MKYNTSLSLFLGLKKRKVSYSELSKKWEATKHFINSIIVN